MWNICILCAPKPAKCFSLLKGEYAGRVGIPCGEGTSPHSSADIQHFNAQSNQNTVFNFRLTAVTSRKNNNSSLPFYFEVLQSFDYFFVFFSRMLSLLFCFWFGYDSVSVDWRARQYFSINIGIFNLFHNFKKLFRHIKNTLAFYLFHVTIERCSWKKLTVEMVWQEWSGKTKTFIFKLQIKSNANI